MDFGALFGNTTNLVMAVTIVPFAIIALIMLLVVLRNGARVRASRNWDSTTGRVLYSGIGSRRSTGSSGSTSTTYYPQVAYEYEVRGQRYQSQRLSFGTVGYGSHRTAETKAAQYIVGAPVEVFFDPANPDQAVLERRSGTNKALVFAVALIVVILVATVALTSSFLGPVGGMFSNLFNPNAPAETSADAPIATKVTAPTPTVRK